MDFDALDYDTMSHDELLAMADKEGFENHATPVRQVERAPSS